MSTSLKYIFAFLGTSVASFLLGCYFGVALWPSRNFVDETKIEKAEVAQLEADSYNQGVKSGRESMIAEVNKVLIDKDLIKFPLDESLSIAYPLVDVYGFVKEVGADGLTLDFDTSQYESLDARRVQKRILADEKTQITLQKKVDAYQPPSSQTANAGKEGEEEQGGASPSSGSAVGILAPSDEGLSPEGVQQPELKRQVTVQNPITLKEIKVGDFVHVITSTDVLKTEGNLTARQIIDIPIENNTYLQGGFPSYKELPVGFSRGMIAPVLEGE